METKDAKYVSVRFRDTYLTQLLELLFNAVKPYPELNNVAIGLIDCGANIHEISDSAFRYAIGREDILLVKYLLNKGLKPSDEVMELAVIKGNQEIFIALLNGNIPDQKYLLKVIETNSTSIAKMLLESPEFGVKPTDEMLNIALVNLNFEIIRDLLECSKETFSKEKIYEAYEIALDNDCDLQFIKCFLKSGVDPNHHDALGLALNNGDYDLAKLLVDHGAKVSEPGLLTWAFGKTEMETFQMMKLLIEAGSDVNNNGDEKHPLKLAIEEGWYEVVKLLLESGARYDVPAYEHSPICYAMSRKLYKIASLLFKNDKDYKWVCFNCDVFTPLRNESFENIKLICESLSIRTLVAFINKNIHLFGLNGNCEVVKYLLKICPLESKNYMTDVLTYLLNRQDHTENQFLVCKMLIDAGASIKGIWPQSEKAYRDFFKSSLNKSDTYKKINTNCQRSKMPIIHEGKYHLCPENPNHCVSHESYIELTDGSIKPLCHYCLVNFSETVYVNKEN